MNKYIAVSYQLYAQPRLSDEEKLQEHRTDDEPFEFITGLNMVLPPFEERITELSAGTSFDFQILPSELYGEYDPELVTEVPISAFNGQDGTPDKNMLYEGNIIQMTDGEGTNFLATVLKVKENEVTIDLNHPQKGMTLHFTGKVMDSRVATDEEVSAMVSALEQSRCGCGGGCGGCGGDCASGCGGGCGGCS